MKNIMVDTNVFISALLKSKNCVKLLEALKRNKFQLIISEKMMEEILFVVEKPKFEFSESEKCELKELIIEKSKSLLKPTEKISVCRDEKDNMVIECAIAGTADFIVTGDKDLLVLKSFRKIPIITPRKFLKIVS